MKVTPRTTAAAVFALALAVPAAFADNIPDDDADTAGTTSYSSDAEVSGTTRLTGDTDVDVDADVDVNAGARLDTSSNAQATGRVGVTAGLEADGMGRDWSRTEPNTTRVGPELDPDDYELAANETVVATAGGTLAKEDREFFERAAIAGMAEIQAAEIARTKAVDADTKAFADMMLGDHGKNNSELKSLAASKGVTLPTTLDRKHADLIEELRDKKSGKDFDDKYSNDMEAAHEDAVKLFEKASKDSKDPDVKAFAAKSLPTLKSHLEMARKLDADK